MANEIATYSTLTGTFGKIKYKENDMTESLSRDLLSAVAHGDFIFFTPYEYPEIVCLNTKTMQITHQTDWLESLRNLTGRTQDLRLGYPYKIDTSLWIPVLDANIIMEYDMEQNNHIFHEIGEKEYRYCSLFFDGSNFWLSPLGLTETPVVKWNLKTCVTSYFPDINIINKKNYFYPLFFFDGHIWLLPMFGEHAVKINIKTGIVSIANEFESGPAEDETGHKLSKFMFAQNSDNNVYVFCSHTGEFIEYNQDKNNRKAGEIKYSSEIVAQLNSLSSYMLLLNAKKVRTIQDCYYYESQSTRLETLIAYLLTEDNDNETQLRERRKESASTLARNADGTAGEKIYHSIKNASH